jgi:type VI secretion system secreted protein VgrG
MPRKVPYRPPRITPRPTVQGPQTAVVVGRAGEEIYTDKYGRVKVQFHWDREGKQNENSSCWIRVSHPWAGKGWGAVAIPRMGQEVIVDFLEGDPDQPIITGRVYNAEQMPPYGLPANQTQTGIKSRSSKGGGADNFNEIRFEDKKGSEEMYIHAEKDQKTVVEHDQTIGVGNDRAESIKRDRSLEVGRDKSEAVRRDKTIQVGRDHNEKINANMAVMVGTNLTETVAINYSETVGAAMELTVGGALAISVGLVMSESIGANKIETVGSSKTESISGNKTLSVGKQLNQTIQKDQIVKIGENLKEEVGGQYTETVQKEYLLQAKKIQFKADDEVSIKTGQAEIIMKKNGDITIKGKKINIEGSGDIIIKGSKIKEN